MAQRYKISRTASRADKKINKFANRTPAKKERVTPTKILLDVW